jgi:hypothetical protein
MRHVFPIWSNGVFRAAIVLFVLLGLLAVCAPMIFVRLPWWRNEWDAVDQPAEFDHRHHAQDDAIDCLYCHDTAERSARAGIPSTEKCMGCHSQIWSQSAQLEPVRRSWFSGLPIPWNRVHRVPDFVYFNHSIHVDTGIGCVTCHGRVDEMARVYQVVPLTMGWCLGCHRDPEPFLRPKSEVTNMDWDPGERERLAVGARLARELDVRKLTHCTTCHR